MPIPSITTSTAAAAADITTDETLPLIRTTSTTTTNPITEHEHEHEHPPSSSPSSSKTLTSLESSESGSGEEGVVNDDDDAGEADPLLILSYGGCDDAGGVPGGGTGGVDVERDAAAAAAGGRRGGGKKRDGDTVGDAVGGRQLVDGLTTTTTAMTQVIMVLLIGVFTSNADGSLVLATHPVIASEFNVLGDSSWLFISFALAGACTQTLYAKLSDIYGRKVLLLSSYALFALGCALVGLGQSYWQVILGRVISGSGGSGMTILIAVLITDLVPLREVAPWQSYLNVVATVGRSLGGPLGGWLADTIGWRWSFLGQASLFILALILCWAILPETHMTRKTHGTVISSHSGESDEAEVHNRFSQIDFLGASLLGLSILTLMLPIEIGGTKISWTNPLIFVLFGLGSLLLVLFLATEAWWAREPIFPLVLLRQRDVIASYLIMGFQMAAQVGIMFSVPLYFQVTARASNTLAGAHLFPAVAGNAVGGMMSGWLIHRTGRYKGLVIIGTLASSSSYLLLMLFWHGHTNWFESMYIIPGGFGTGIAQSAVFISLQAAINPEHKAAAVSGLFLTWPIGMIVGVAAMSAAMLEVLRKNLDNRLIQLHFDLAKREEIIKNAVSNVDYLDQISGRVLQAVVASYVDGLWWSHGLSLICALLGFVAALFLQEHKL